MPCGKCGKTKPNGKCCNWGANNWCQDLLCQEAPFVELQRNRFQCEKFHYPECGPSCERSEYSDDTDYDVYCADLSEAPEDMRRTCTRGPDACKDCGKEKNKCCCRRQRPIKCYPEPEKCKSESQSGWISVCDEKEEAPKPAARAVKATDAKKEEAVEDTSSEHKAEKQKVKAFEFTLVDGALSPNAQRIPLGAKVWAINGHAGARLNLKAGKTYYFKVTQEGDPANFQQFYLTRDPEGGPSDVWPQLMIPGTQPITNGIIPLKVDERTPTCFYYQSKEVGFAGGSIYVYC